MLKNLIIIFSLLIINQIYAQTESEQLVCNGVKVGASPILGYNSDLGILYGGVINLFDYGKDSIYPDYKYSIYQEVSRSTMENLKFKTRFDSRHLINKIRINAELLFRIDRALNFYGFNGAFIQDDYNSAFYRIEREVSMIRVANLYSIGNNFNMYSGLSYLDVELMRLEGVSKTLYDQLSNNNLILDNQMNGGATAFLEYGLTYDSRDNEKNPRQGIWSEVFMMSSFYNTQQIHSHKLINITRLYYSLHKKLVFASRTGVQLDLARKTPFYLLPYAFSTTRVNDGLGGFKTIRGLSLNRLVGKGVAYANVEVRYTFLKGVYFNRNIFLSLTPFVDGGCIVQEYMKDHTFNQNIEKNVLLLCTGSGLRLGINENFILSFDYGVTINARFPNQAAYSGLNFLF